MGKQIKFIYFDVGGVLLQFEHIRTECAVELGLDPEEFSNFLNSFSSRLGDGSTDEFEVEEALRQHFKLDLPAGFWSDCTFVERFRPIPEMHALATELAEQYRVGILSNVSRLVAKKSATLPHLLPKVAFDPVIWSAHVGLAKPDPRIFQLAITKAGLPAEQILFIDDLAANLAAAAEAGMQTFQFNPKDVASSVKALKLFIGV
jgi:epoxide hydrolase-like predicted phosphatase